MLTITKKFEFCYEHFLPEYDGLCANTHGHNSVVEVEIGQSGTPVSYESMVMDFGEVKEICKPIIDQLDHKLINTYPPFVDFCYLVGLTEPIPTAESICCFLVNEIKKEIPTLVRLRITETPDSWAEWSK